MSSKLQSLWTEGGQRLEEAGIEEGVREALSMVTRLLDEDPGKVIVKALEPIPADFDIDTYHSWIERRLKREPLAYIFGEREFFGRPFKVGPGALVPRPDSEILVEAVLEAHSKKPFSRGLDFCSGPGTLGLTLSLELEIPFHLVEINPEAMAWAEKNLRLLGAREVSLHLEDAMDFESTGDFDLIICNPPYVESEEMPRLMPEVRDYEPAQALDGGPGGLVFFYDLLEELRRKVKKPCDLFVEVGSKHRKAIDGAPPQGWTRHAWHKDLAGVDRVAHYIFSDEVHG